MTALADAVTRAVRAQAAKSTDWQSVTVSVVNSDGTCDVTTADGSTIPKVRRARAYVAPAVGDLAVMHRSENGNRYLAGTLTTSAAAWQTPAALGTGWAAGPAAGSVQAVQYRKDGDNLIIAGAVHSTSTSPAATIFTLPAGYRPAITQRSPGVSNSGGTATARYVEINSTGAVSINANLTTSSTDIYFQVSVPLGGIPNY